MTEGIALLQEALHLLNEYLHDTEVLKKFFAEYPDLPQEFGNGIRPEIKYEMGRVWLSLRLPGRITQRRFVSSWPDIGRWMDAVDEWNRAKGFHPRSQVEDIVLSMFVEGDMSYQDVTDELNHQISELLEAQVEEERRLGEQFEVGPPASMKATQWKIITGERGPMPRGHEICWLILRSLKMDEQEISDLITDAVENLRQGRPAFLPGLPVERQRVVNRMRDFKSGTDLAP